MKLALTVAAFVGVSTFAATAHANWWGNHWATSHFFTGTHVKEPASLNYFRMQNPEPAKPTLLLFLPGTGDDNGDLYTEFYDKAAAHGYYVISLDYRHNHHHPHMVGCWSNADADYFEEQVAGAWWGWWQDDANNGFDAASNSIETRLHKLLLQLQSEQPGPVSFNWMQFWSGSAPNWQQIVVAGHSQGGSTAAYIAATRPVKGALVFEGFYDNLNIGLPDAGTPGDSLVPAWTLVGSADCNGQAGDVVPGWITPGPWATHMIVVDAELSGTHTGSWAGHHIPVAAAAVGKLDTLIQTTPSSIANSYYTVQNVVHHYPAPDTYINTPPAAEPCNSSYHKEPIANDCGPTWLPAFWGMLLERAKTLDSNPIAN